ncbi:LRR receptor-like serine/threonine-protein [Vigna angularis]|uniref:LRR receptor-like serine/threonine-protein n=1 Tax=Phaseolus angularis TaxID=3914 RepID=A0A8T0L1I1_PHAAN|nr:LRR receptor-like serine/threonine-protein [Vigna angularis]
MSLPFYFSLCFIFSLSFILPPPSLAANDTVPCPLNITVLRVVGGGARPSFDSGTQCHYILQALHLLQADYLRRSNLFVPPLNASESCWTSFQSFINEFDPSIDIRSSCGLKTEWISQGCMNITTKQQFEATVPTAAIQAVQGNCNQSLDNNAPCALCTTKISTLLSYLTGPTVGNVSDCRAYTSIYAASLSDQYGATDPGTAKCLFGLDFSSPGSSGKRRTIVIVVSVFCFVALLVLAAVWTYIRFKKRNEFGGGKGVGKSELGLGLGSGLDSMNQSTTLIRFSFDEIKKATRNFSRDNMIGSGGYGNVYKGMLLDGSPVAFKRFKNCSVAGDASFTHEVEVIASVRHVNLVTLRGYCTATTNLEGHQRIIVTDLMENGSLYDHLFGSSKKNLSCALDVVEDGIPEPGPPEVLEKYVLIAVLCSHPQLYARPTMDQVVKMLETDESVPSLMDRPIPFIAGRIDIEKSALSNSGQLCSPTGYQAYTLQNQRKSICKEDEEEEEGSSVADTVTTE